LIPSGREYQAYRAVKTLEGVGFELFTLNLALGYGHPAHRWTTAKDQIAHGDLNIEGDNLEVKRDGKISTGNVFIETAEWSSTRQAWVPSGIDATSDARYYLVGDEHVRYVFERAWLRELRKAYPIVTLKSESGQGFKLPRTVAVRATVDHLLWAHHLMIRHEDR